MNFAELYHKIVIAIASNYKANELNPEVNARISKKALDLALQANQIYIDYKNHR